ncbi:cation:proton antiporter [Roseateles violae]|uniref:Cation:proton antiporter n=1 Tax=Roseateles violae TaxID=3058042 RepID=A0ABT8DPZ2_9BURK|nr:cation:proton antiporter [Pelomonas sp. PFR6]MDN3920212.1 cation:proton antiporter [Pelomonas sp. PFR6]
MGQLAAFFHFDRWPPQPDLLFWFALTLLGGALLGGAVSGRLGLPRIVGYSAAGMIVAALGRGLGDGRLLGTDRLIVDLALALLLFELGSRVSLRWLRVNPALLVTSVLESLLSFWAIFAVLRWFELAPPLALAGAALLGVSAAAVIGRVVTELRSAGQVSERMIVLGALNTLYAVLLVKLVIGWLHLDRSGDWIQGLLQPVYTFGGSVLVAALLATAVGWVVRRFDLRDENSVLLLLGLLLLALTAARLLALSTLLVPLLAGVMLRNASERPCIWPRHFGTAGGVLVLMLFVIMGAAWSPASLVAGFAVAALVLIVRALTKVLVLAATAHFSGIAQRQSFALAMGLTPISVTSLVLLADLQLSHPAIAAELVAPTLAANALMALLGPVLVQGGLRLAREYHPAPAAGRREARSGPEAVGGESV